MQKNPDQQKMKLMQSTTLISVPLEAFLVTMDNCQDMTSLLLFEHFLAHADNHEIESNITRKTGLSDSLSKTSKIAGISKISVLSFGTMGEEVPMVHYLWHIYFGSILSKS